MGGLIVVWYESMQSWREGTQRAQRRRKGGEGLDNLGGLCVQKARVRNRAGAEENQLSPPRRGIILVETQTKII